ncbi:hypothetical protein SDC9_90305 [bioreactor metagenome]|uniref:Uncharacterized protein n=1 Tax=bioreactor metagenome TaxID=1076179 RepID=A0A644ZTA8_9ZZZZ
MPTGSIFSMLHTVIQLPKLSLITSYSTSFQPLTLFSTNTCPIELSISPEAKISCSSSSLFAIPPPVPPRVYAGLMITGYPIFFANFLPLSMSVIISLSIQGSLISSITFLNNSLSSPIFIESIVVPITLTPYLSNIPFSYSSTDRLRAVCPPIPAIRESGLSFSITFSTNSIVKGSIYTLSAIFLSVIIVAGLEFIRTTSIPSSFNA